jgi:hypothetical protein
LTGQDSVAIRPRPFSLFSVKMLWNEVATHVFLDVARGAKEERWREKG